MQCSELKSSSACYEGWNSRGCFVVYTLRHPCFDDAVNLKEEPSCISLLRGLPDITAKLRPS
jgi:hypothetical protein